MTEMTVMTELNELNKINDLVLETAFRQRQPVRHNVLASYLPDFRIVSKIADGVFRMECDGHEMIYPRDFNNEISWYLVKE